MSSCTFGLESRRVIGLGLLAELLLDNNRIAISGHARYFSLAEIRSVYTEGLGVFSSLSYVLLHRPASLLNRLTGSHPAANRLASLLRLLLLGAVVVVLWQLPAPWPRVGVVGLISLLVGFWAFKRASHGLVLVRDTGAQSGQVLIRSVVHVGSGDDVAALQNKILLELHKRDLRDKRSQGQQNWQTLYSSPFPDGVGARYRSDPADLFLGRRN